MVVVDVSCVGSVFWFIGLLVGLVASATEDGMLVSLLVDFVGLVLVDHVLVDCCLLFLCSLCFFARALCWRVCLSVQF